MGNADVETPALLHCIKMSRQAAGAAYHGGQEGLWLDTRPPYGSSKLGARERRSPIQRRKRNNGVRPCSLNASELNVALTA